MVQVTGARAYLDAGEDDGLAVGQVLALRRGEGEAGQCTVDAVAPGHATCTGGAPRPGDAFRLAQRPAPAVKLVQLPPVPSEQELAGRAVKLAGAPIAQVVDKASGPATSLALPRSVLGEVALVGATWDVSTGGAFEVARIDAAFHGAPVGPLLVDVDLRAERWLQQYKPTFRPDDQNRFYLWQAQAGWYPADRRITLDAGRVLAMSVPGATVMDGAIVGRRSDGYQVSVFGGLVPEPDTLAPTTTRATAGAAWELERRPGKGILFRQEGRLAWVRSPELGDRAELQATGALHAGSTLDLSADVRVGAGGTTHAPGYLDGARVELGLRPVAKLALSAGFDYGGLTVPQPIVAALYPGRTRHADVSAFYDLGALRLGVDAGRSVDVVSSLERSWVGPETPAPALLHGAGGPLRRVPRGAGHLSRPQRLRPGGGPPLGPAAAHRARVLELPGLARPRPERARRFALGRRGADRSHRTSSLGALPGGAGHGRRRLVTLRSQRVRVGVRAVLGAAAFDWTPEWGARSTHPGPLVRLFSRESLLQVSRSEGDDMRASAPFVAVLSGLVVGALPSRAQAGCAEVLAALASRAVDVSCVDSFNLTTNNPATTPPNNSIAGLPAGAFTPQTDRGVISPNSPDRTPITKAVPGIQVQGRFADDPTGQARFLLRFPADWNGSLVVAGASGTRSEFNGDFAWSDYVVQKGYAYASQNKGVLNLSIVSLSSPTPPDAESCRLNPASGIWVHFFDDDAQKPFTQWTEYMIAGARLARDAVKVQYRHHPRRTYAVGTSNGGYQVRRAIEEAPDLFDGGVDWEGTFVDPAGPNLLIDLPPAIASFPEYVASGFAPGSAAAQRIEAAGYPPDIVAGGASLWGLYWAQFWEVTQCQWQKRFDPSFTTYVDGPNDAAGHGGLRLPGRAAAGSPRRGRSGGRSHRGGDDGAAHDRAGEGRALARPSSEARARTRRRSRATTEAAPPRTGCTRSRTETTSRPSRTRSRSSSSSSPMPSGRSICSWTTSRRARHSRRASASPGGARSRRTRPSRATVRSCSCRSSRAPAPRRSARNGPRGSKVQLCLDRELVRVAPSPRRAAGRTGPNRRGTAGDEGNHESSPDDTSRRPNGDGRHAGARRRLRGGRLRPHGAADRRARPRTRSPSSTRATRSAPAALRGQGARPARPTS